MEYRFVPLLALLSTLAAAAQQPPFLEVFGGYSYFRLGEDKYSGLTAASLNGWHAALKLNVRPRIGFVFEASGHYGEQRMAPTQFQPRETYSGDVRRHFVLLGPELRLYTKDRLTVNVRALIGAAYTNTLVLPLKEPFRPPGGEQPLVTEFRIGESKPLAAALGGSVDYRITDSLSWRLIQPDFVVTELGSHNVKALRVSTGLVFTLGGR